jgi:hypothetical protein
MLNLKETHTAVLNMMNEQKEFGLVNEVHVDDDNTISYTYPAPVLSGQCWATVVIHDDLSITMDDDMHFTNLDAWLASEIEVRDI